MDDGGQCLLDVISDPQLLQSFLENSSNNNNNTNNINPTVQQDVNQSTSTPIVVGLTQQPQLQQHQQSITSTATAIITTSTINDLPTSTPSLSLSTPQTIVVATLPSTLTSSTIVNSRNNNFIISNNNNLAPNSKLITTTTTTTATNNRKNESAVKAKKSSPGAGSRSRSSKTSANNSGQAKNVYQTTPSMTSTAATPNGIILDPLLKQFQGGGPHAATFSIPISIGGQNLMATPGNTGISQTLQLANHHSNSNNNASNAFNTTMLAQNIPTPSPSAAGTPTAAQFMSTQIQLGPRSTMQLLQPQQFILPSGLQVQASGGQHNGGHGPQFVITRPPLAGNASPAATATNNAITPAPINTIQHGTQLLQIIQTSQGPQLIAAQPSLHPSPVPSPQPTFTPTSMNMIPSMVVTSSSQQQPQISQPSTTAKGSKSKNLYSKPKSSSSSSVVSSSSSVSSNLSNNQQTLVNNQASKHPQPITSNINQLMINSPTQQATIKLFQHPQSSLAAATGQFSVPTSTTTATGPNAQFLLGPQSGVSGSGGGQIITGPNGTFFLPSSANTHHQLGAPSSTPILLQGNGQSQPQQQQQSQPFQLAIRPGGVGGPQFFLNPNASTLAPIANQLNHDHLIQKTSTGTHTFVTGNPNLLNQTGGLIRPQNGPTANLIIRPPSLPSAQQNHRQPLTMQPQQQQPPAPPQYIQIQTPNGPILLQLQVNQTSTPTQPPPPPPPPPPTPPPPPQQQQHPQTIQIGNTLFQLTANPGTNNLISAAAHQNPLSILNQSQPSQQTQTIHNPHQDLTQNIHHQTVSQTPLILAAHPNLQQQPIVSTAPTLFNVEKPSGRAPGSRTGSKTPSNNDTSNSNKKAKGLNLADLLKETGILTDFSPPTSPTTPTQQQSTPTSVVAVTSTPTMSIMKNLSNKSTFDTTSNATTLNFDPSNAPVSQQQLQTDGSSIFMVPNATTAVNSNVIAADQTPTPPQQTQLRLTVTPDGTLVLLSPNSGSLLGGGSAGTPPQSLQSITTTNPMINHQSIQRQQQPNSATSGKDLNGLGSSQPSPDSTTPSLDNNNGSPASTTLSGSTLLEGNDSKNLFVQSQMATNDLVVSSLTDTPNNLLPSQQNQSISEAAGTAAKPQAIPKAMMFAKQNEPTPTPVLITISFDGLPGFMNKLDLHLQSFNSMVVTKMSKEQQELFLELSQLKKNISTLIQQQQITSDKMLQLKLSVPAEKLLQSSESAIVPPPPLPPSPVIVSNDNTTSSTPSTISPTALKIVISPNTPATVAKSVLPSPTPIVSDVEIKPPLILGVVGATKTTTPEAAVPKASEIVPAPSSVVVASPKSPIVTPLMVQITPQQPPVMVSMAASNSPVPTKTIPLLPAAVVGVPESSDKPKVLMVATATPVSPSATQALKPPEKPKSNVLRAILSQLHADQNTALHPDYRTPFRSRDDACKRLLRYHVFDQPIMTKKKIDQFDELYEVLAKNLLHKKRLIFEKFRYLQLKQSMRDSISSEYVMVSRMIIEEEKESLKSDKESVASGKILDLPPLPKSWLQLPMLEVNDDVDNRMINEDDFSFIDHSNEREKQRIKQEFDGQSEQLSSESEMTLLTEPVINELSCKDMFVEEEPPPPLPPPEISGSEDHNSDSNIIDQLIQNLESEQSTIQASSLTELSQDHIETMNFIDELVGSADHNDEQNNQNNDNSNDDDKSLSMVTDDLELLYSNMARDDGNSSLMVNNDSWSTTNRTNLLQTSRINHNHHMAASQWSSSFQNLNEAEAAVAVQSIMMDDNDDGVVIGDSDNGCNENSLIQDQEHTNDSMDNFLDGMIMNHNNHIEDEEKMIIDNDEQNEKNRLLVLNNDDEHQESEDLQTHCAIKSISSSINDSYHRQPNHNDHGVNHQRSMMMMMNNGGVGGSLGSRQHHQNHSFGMNSGHHNHHQMRSTPFGSSSSSSTPSIIDPMLDEAVKSIL